MVIKMMCRFFTMLNSNSMLILLFIIYPSGNFGVVHKAVLKRDGDKIDVAVKTITSETFAFI